MKKEKEIDINEDAIPVCEKCGNAKVEENGKWVCPSCQGEIDFLGGEDE